MRLCKLTFGLFTLIALVGISQACSKSVNEQNSNRICGADSDAHGCKGSAGYVWSEVLHECVRPWETGEAVAVPQEDGDTYTKEYHIVFSADSAEAELIGIGMLTRTDASTWSGSDMAVVRTAGGYTLSKSGK